MKIWSLLCVLLLIMSYCTSKAQSIPTEAKDISPLLIGETIPSGTLRSLEGEDIPINEIFSKKPTVLIYYRGGWCPYCNLQLSGLQKIKLDILELGYQIIAVAPDAPNELSSTIDKNELEYALYSDPGLQVAQSIGIAFRATKRHVEKLTRYSDGTNEDLLPVPSVFVLDQGGLILFEYINPDYKVRMNEDLLLAAIKALQSEQD